MTKLNFKTYSKANGPPPPIEDELYKERFPNADHSYYIYCISSDAYQLFASELEAIMDRSFYNTAEKSSTNARMECMVL